MQISALYFFGCTGNSWAAGDTTGPSCFTTVLGTTVNIAALQGGTIKKGQNVTHVGEQRNKGMETTEGATRAEKCEEVLHDKGANICVAARNGLTLEQINSTFE